ncbi:DNA glycosylase AlkZ-like family protein [Pseudarthrobacter sp. P1]|uniref:DNA glycosylase AlkZ-like family protein n=1 Tax=Pseudarthrobacter sp. P1 TaxID=3418418 RepID=UPI003CF89208
MTHDLLELGWRYDGAQPSCLLVDGKVEATWGIGRSRGHAVLTIAPLSPLGASVRDEIAHEGEALLAFLAAGDDVDLRFVD